MNWRDFIAELYGKAPHAVGFTCKPDFRPSASIAEIANLERQLNTLLSTDLRSLLLDTNGVMNLMKIDDGDWFEEHWLLWTVAEIIEQNIYLRRASMRPYDDNRPYCPRADGLLFFANDGADGIFAHPVKAQRAAEPSVLVWTPIGDELTSIAWSLKDFVEGWLTGQTPRY
jgi:hypothetical protein